MKPILIDKKSSLKDIVEIKEMRVRFLDTPLHFHNAYEMVLIRKGSGRRIIGDNIEHFNDGDLVLMGPSLPHVWYNEREYYFKKSRQEVSAIIVYFHLDWLIEDSSKYPGLNHVKKLLKQIDRGIKITGKTQRKISQCLPGLRESESLARIIFILSSLQGLCGTRDFECLASEGYINRYTPLDVGRIDKVYQYVMNHYTGRIRLEEIAAIANMSPTAFCRYFRTRTQKTFVEFVNEVRVAHASKLLCDENLSISEICYQCGFNTHTNFSKIFREFTSLTPTQFRESLKHNNHPAKQAS